MLDISFVIREFEINDVKDLANLNNELGYPSSELEMFKRLKIISNNENYKTIVADLENNIVGYIGLSRNYFWEQNGEYLRVQALVVTKNYRKLGIGKKLIEFAENWAKEIEAKAILLNCGNRTEREIAHKFYIKLGFEIKSTGYSKKV